MLDRKAPGEGVTDDSELSTGEPRLEPGSRELTIDHLTRLRPLIVRDRNDPLPDLRITRRGKPELDVKHDR